MHREADWPVQPGSYALLLTIRAPLRFKAGRRGEIVLPAGRYAYTGTARAMGGLRSRLARHMRSEKRTYWHIDYLTQYAIVSAVYWQVTTESLECRWAQALLQLPGASAPARGFGNSDCHAGCPAHLIRLPDDFTAEKLKDLLDAGQKP
ncbi:MAG: GIY-YIG nuclease family protein [Anaerolineae bacterium]